jgi:hypothetical protein
MIPNGSYTAKAKSGALGTTSGGKEQVAVQFVVGDGEQAGETITWYGYFTEKSVDRTLESLRIAGWRGDDLADLSDLSREDAPVVELVIAAEVYEGKTNARVKWINRPGNGPALKKQLDAPAAQSFAEKMRVRVAAFDAKNPTAKVAAPPPSGDVPF